MNNSSTARQQANLNEIRQAIKIVQRPERSTQKDGTIQVITPPYEVYYRYTCPHCGCHIVSNYTIPDGDGSANNRLCIGCHAIYTPGAKCHHGWVNGALDGDRPRRWHTRSVPFDARSPPRFSNGGHGNRDSL